ncbi:MAG TPA: alpha amylase N-terminal ig-like domain-containing protein [Herpetosiphonaceae bacterium]
MSDTTRRRTPARLAMLLVLFASLLSPNLIIRPQPAMALPAAPTGDLAAAPASPADDNWCVAGSFQDWNNASTPLYDDGSHGDLQAGDGVYSLDVTIPAVERYEWKALTCGSWDTTYPPGPNSWFFTTAANQTVKLTFDTNDHAGDAGADYLPARYVLHAQDSLPASFTAVGSFQGWSNNNPATLMANLGNGIYRLAYVIPAAGSYEGKIVRTGSWAEQYGAFGRAVDQGNIAFSTTAPNQTVVFLLDTRSSRSLIAVNGAGGGNWCAAGSFQGWNNASTPLNDAGANGDLLGGDGVYGLDVTIPAAGRYEWKAVECGNWNNAHPPINSWFVTAAVSQTVKLQFDTNNHANDAGPDLLPAQNILSAWDSAGPFTAAGPWQGWSNDNPATQLIDLGNGLRRLSYVIAAPGEQEAKIVRTGSWGEQYVAQGRAADGTPAPDPLLFTTGNLSETVIFTLDDRSGRLGIAPQGDGVLPLEVGDGYITRDAIEHQSRSSLYKVPFGAVTQQQTVTLRLRTAAHDVERVQARVYSTATQAQSLREMARVNGDESYDYWQLSIPAQNAKTVLYYRFVISDGDTTVYYEDDDRFDGGLGEVVNTSGDRSWNIYVYDPAFDAPAWAKNGIIYQIFAERFRNGDASNDPTADPATDRGWFYPTERGHRFPITPWNTIVPDPEPYTDDTRPYWATYSSTMYGGDLQGVTQKLDYLQSLGVTIVYLNPIFDSPSNHKYDGRDYRVVDPAFGGQPAFDQLVQGLHARGMKLVLDGVPNHVSSDSPFFDRFNRFPTVGACESLASPYRSWFFFEPATPAGTGVCAGDTNYRGWFGVATLPQINTAHPQVLDYWFREGNNPNDKGAARYWLAQGADGWRIDVVPDVIGVNPTFFEDFRAATKDEKPDSMSYSETWGEGDVRDRVLGDEFDSTMNYRYRKAVLGFIRDTRWTDNDGGQEIDPLSPSQFINAFKTIEEDYPAPAFQSAMNLIDSHDTNRAVHVLNEEGFTGTGYDRQPVDGFVAARARLGLVAGLQMTLPGAPTIYYGDEVGLTGYGYDVPRDDPYNRQPYPWSDQPGYSSLPEWRKADPTLLSHYQALGTLRNSKSYLRTGSLDELRADDEAKILAYGRKDATGAAIVVFNRGTTPQTVTLDLATYIPNGVALLKSYPAGPASAPAANQRYTFVVAPQSFGVWTTPTNASMGIPAAATNLAAAPGNGQVSLSWNAVGGAAGYAVYRSPVSGGGYQRIGGATATSYVDAAVVNGQRYFYVVRALGANGLESADSNESAATPAFPIDFALLQYPQEITHTLGVTATAPIYGRVRIPGVTDANGSDAGIIAQVGFGPRGSDPRAWTSWQPAARNAGCLQCGDFYEFAGQLRPETAGTYDLLYRFSTDGGLSWTFGDRNGPIPPHKLYLPTIRVVSSAPLQAGEAPVAAAQPPIDPQFDKPGLLRVLANSDTTPPAAPANLRLPDWSAGFITAQWNAVGDAAEYWVYRKVGADAFGAPLARVAAPATSYTDLTVTSGVTYTYAVKAVDPALNLSAFSNQASQRAEVKNALVTFRVRVPAETPAGSTIYIAGNDSRVFGASWNPGFQPMTRVGATDIWEYQVSVPEGTALQYKYTRGAWERVEWWGTITSVANRTVTTGYEPGGTFVVDDTATDWGSGSDEHKGVQYWRDPLVSDTTPASGGGGGAPTSVIAVWSTPVEPTGALTAVLTLQRGATPIAGATARLTGASFIFTPDAPLAPGTYTATAAAVKRSDIGGEAVPQQAPYVWTFTIAP